MMRTDVRKEGVLYQVINDETGALTYEKWVYFAQDKPHRPGGYLFKQAAREQEMIALMGKEKSEMKYQVIVSNIGQVYDGNSQIEARRIYREYVRQSKSNEGRAAGESVTVVRNGEPLFDFTGALGELEESEDAE